MVIQMNKATVAAATMALIFTTTTIHLHYTTVEAFHTITPGFQYPRTTSTPQLSKTTTSSSSLSTSQLYVGGSGLGWDNENFLESLGKGSDEIDKANAEYKRTSRFRPEDMYNPLTDQDEDITTRFTATGGSSASRSTPGSSSSDDIPDQSIPGADAGLTSERVERIKRQNEDEANASGGEMFKKLMERAEQAAQQQPLRPPPPPAQRPSSPPESTMTNTNTGDSGGGGGLPANFNTLSVEQQAALFRELMSQQATAAAGGGAVDGGNTQVFPPPPGDRPFASGVAPTSKDGRRFGRNRDADAIVNSSDVYLAQLKIDSKTRNFARYNGDDDTANKVFDDPRIRELKLHTNPYLEEQRQAERALYGGGNIDDLLSPDLMASDRYRDNLPQSHSGISYKDKLLQKKQQQQGGGSSVNTDSKGTSSTNNNNNYSGTTSSSSSSGGGSSYQPEQASIPQSPYKEATKVSSSSLRLDEEIILYSEPQAAVVDSTFASSTASTTAPSYTIPTTTSTTTTPQGYVTPLPTSVSSSSSSSTATVPSTEDMRRDIRTLMGLLLKHRGGPGFGVGRIQGNEMKRFIDLSDQIMKQLKNEEPIPQQQVLPSLSSIPVSNTIIPSPPTTTTSIQQGNKVERINGMIGCIQGAVQMYKFSPPELKGSVLVTLRAALLSAVGTCNDIIADDTQPIGGNSNDSSRNLGLSATDRINSMIGYLEGALQMYSYSPPELQTGVVLITIRAALLSAINTCNEIIAENDVRVYEQTNVRGIDIGNGGVVIDSTMVTETTKTTDINTPPPAMITTTTTTSQSSSLYDGTDTNTQFLTTVYNKLQNAAGNGKLGLKNSITSDEANELASDLSDMRSMLIEELNGSGIPPPSSASSSSTSSSAASKYQAMLAKARAEKEQQSEN